MANGHGRELYNRLHDGSIPPLLMAQPYLHLHTMFGFETPAGECWTSRPSSRSATHYLHESDGVVLLFRARLIETRLGLPEVTYDVRDEFAFCPPGAKSTAQRNKLKLLCDVLRVSLLRRHVRPYLPEPQKSHGNLGPHD